ncbi:MAG TPA: NAD-dependent succinate-semialdehyde dehydrogenase [Solirubrobacterales bacterium]|jgi:succinate-semialdehyde dehydrogenase/glutarate-semialdehyde dehydrogenase|nr:NAD-dependent succinate-semialdehyde dehydrogenase [Solirubrobacterales bacterium]HMU25879.1 NAD-dependent succinate-semialdehyde dehydrogenase [Solirubrobacterales bacterium]HMY26292.1 NAD-dependent succinate-semialdehyde dehydrogenase [Solirubrobacterales bacterium]HNA22997.1 NAD-dependent succinate-semialdehyde dehydrogenase [Solirubrobacterales bacterium]HNA43356.1 NAD-dependent succinate-semialdehyde dehydrogenase [Solirubrobacterales bacterium]
MSDYAVVNPATGETVKEYPTISDAGLQEAIASAEDAFRDWSKNSSIEERAAAVRRVGELHVERREELADIIIREMGKPREQALGEIDFCGDIYGFYADNAEKLLADEPIELLAGEGDALIRKSAMGPLIGIMPWNFPYYQVARFAGPNLTVGNPVLLKPAPQCPESAEAIAKMMDDAGVPSGAYQTILATNDQIADAIADPRVRGVSLTGSERAGAAVAEIAGRNLKKVVLELGGSDPFILLGSGDLEEAIQSAVDARLDNTGQSCNAAKRFIVTEDLYDDFLAGFTEKMKSVEPGDPASDETAIGPLSSSTATERLQDQLDRAVAQGAEVVVGGERNGNFFPVTVLTGVTPENDAYREEFFGPVATVYKVASEDEAVELANDTPFGLGSYVFTDDPEQARRVAENLDTGMVYVNGVGLDGAELPFGGVKRSGFGRELGTYGIQEFINKKLIRTLK